MRIARKLMLLALAFSALMALNAATATAATVSQEGGSTCTSVTETVGGNPEISGGCPLKGLSAGHMELAGPFGAMVRCNVSLEGRVNGVGHAIGTYTTSNCEQNSAVPCINNAEKHVEAEIDGPEVPVGSEMRYSVEAEFCARATIGIITTEIDCHLPGHIVQTNHTTQRLEFHNSGVHRACEDETAYGLLGTINIVVDAAHPAVEITH